MDVDDSDSENWSSENESSSKLDRNGVLPSMTKDDGLKTFTCNVCEMIFKKQSRLDSHFRSHSGERPYVCPEVACGKTFIRCDHLSRHMKSHNGERKYLCLENNCSMAFITAFHLKRHVLTHIQPTKTYPCLSCSEKFVKKSSLRSHRATEHNEVEFKCYMENCGRVFPTKSKLDRHQSKHDASEKQILLQSAVNDHSNTTMTDNFICQNISPTSRKRVRSDSYLVNTFRCTYEGCDRYYTQAKNLRAHIRAVHEMDSQFVCNYQNCGQKFGFPSSLRRHIQNIHVENKNPRICIPKDRTLRTQLIWQTVEKLIQNNTTDGNTVL